MAKNFASLYNSGNVSNALESSFFVKEETTRGVLEIPLDADAVRVLAGSSLNLTQAKESSPQRSGRHNDDVTLGKKLTEWSIPAFVNIDTAVAQGVTELDQAMRTLLKSTFGRETTPAAVIYDAATAPDITFTVMENGDIMAKQSAGCFVNSMSLDAPGDGTAQYEFAGQGKDTVYAGICKTEVVNDAGNDITVLAADKDKIEAGALVMLIKADGVTRSADTPNGSPRRVTSVDATGLIITVDGAVLADADGSGADLFLAYYEPETPTSIKGIQTGLVGSITIDNIPNLGCVRSFNLSIENNHTIFDDCYGESGLGGSLFAPGGRFDVSVEMELLLDAGKVGYLINKKQFTSDDITFILGDASTRHVWINMPKVIFDLPEVPTPDDGVVPINLNGGMAFETDYLLGDEISYQYR